MQLQPAHSNSDIRCVSYRIFRPRTSGDSVFDELSNEPIGEAIRCVGDLEVRAVRWCMRWVWALGGRIPCVVTLHAPRVLQGRPDPWYGWPPPYVRQHLTRKRTRDAEYS